MKAVAVVTLNRAYRSKDYPDTVCKVVYQRSQFSWTKTLRKTPRSSSESFKGGGWYVALAIAEKAYRGRYSPFLVSPEESCRPLYFHNTSVNPYWNKEKKLCYRIGRHKFYE